MIPIDIGNTGKGSCFQCASVQYTHMFAQGRMCTVLQMMEIEIFSAEPDVLMSAVK